MEVGKQVATGERRSSKEKSCLTLSMRLIRCYTLPHPCAMVFSSGAGE